MDRLSAADALMVHGESPEWHLHVTSLLLLDRSTAPGSYSFDAYRQAIARRLRGVRRFRQRVATVPLGLDRPVWVDIGAFDAEQHIRRVEVKTGSRGELFAVAANEASRKLPHGRPLWEILVLEAPGGRLEALVVKNHHAMFDGVGGLESMQAMFDLTADAAHEAVTRDVPAGQTAPGAAELLAQSAIRGLVVQPWETVKVARQLLGQAAALGREVLTGRRPRLGVDVPASPFAGPITSQRVASGVSLSLAVIKGIRRQADVTVNDVLLTVIGGALRAYLTDRARLPQTALVANVAVSTRSDQEPQDAGNKISVMLVGLGTDIESPGERLSTIHADGAKAKRFRERLAGHGDTTILAAAPPVVPAVLGRLYRAARLSDTVRVIGNVGVSNVAGPPAQLYVCGAAVRAMFVFGPLMLNSAVNFTAVSNADRMDVAITTSPSVLDDVADLAHYVQPALDALAAQFGAAGA
jgi:diacylglycerol O-acyltransferase / wax synthase